MQSLKDKNSRCDSLSFSLKMQRNGEEEENCIFSFFSNFFSISHAGLFILFNESVIASFKK